MRRSVDRAKLAELMRRIARDAQGPGKIYFAGGTSMLLWGIRDQTIDVDMKMDPEPRGVFEAIARLKNELDVNVELASPDDFIPAPPDWRERSPLIETIGAIEYYHYDPVMQALAKLERGHAQDLKDCKAILDQLAVRTQDLRELFFQISPLIV